MSCFGCGGSGSSKDEHLIDIPALGREFKLGGLYNYFGESVGKTNHAFAKPLEGLAGLHPLEKVDDTLQGIGKALGANEKTLLNILVGYYPSTPIPKVIENVCKRGNRNRMIVKFEYTSKTSELSVNDFKKAYSEGKRQQAYQVVRKITYGQRVFLIFEENEYKDEINIKEKGLFTCLQAFENGQQPAETDLQAFCKFECQLYYEDDRKFIFDVSEPWKSYFDLKKSLFSQEPVCLSVSFFPLTKQNDKTSDSIEFAINYFNALATLRSEMYVMGRKDKDEQNLDRIETELKGRIQSLLRGMKQDNSMGERLRSTIKEIDEKIISELKIETLIAKKVSEPSQFGSVRTRASLRKIASKLRKNQQLLMANLRKENLSELVHEGKPNIYKLKVRPDSEVPSYRRYQVLQPDEESKVANKTMLLVGSSRSGKTTLINAIANHLFGVNITDKWRFIVTDEAESGSETSAISTISSYTLHYQRGFRHNVTLTVIDTPGLDGSQERDKEVCDAIKKFVQSGSIRKVDCVGFVVQAFHSRLNAEQKNAFDLVNNLFPPDMPKTILLTFADAQEAPVLNALEDAGVLIERSYRFNNSVLYRGSEEGINRRLWEAQSLSFELFFKHLTGQSGV